MKYSILALLTAFVVAAAAAPRVSGPGPVINHFALSNARAGSRWHKQDKVVYGHESSAILEIEPRPKPVGLLHKRDGAVDGELSSPTLEMDPELLICRFVRAPGIDHLLSTFTKGKRRIDPKRSPSSLAGSLCSVWQLSYHKLSRVAAARGWLGGRETLTTTKEARNRR
ncbi:hypothetical protein C8R44DRAFT_754333 [Mycena epipterygia]|nr:hypothetical protein C8R44DRAFT_754333 [Mycena epipterygia]